MSETLWAGSRGDHKTHTKMSHTGYSSEKPHKYKMESEHIVTRVEFSTVLARLDALEKENKRLREENAAMSCQLWNLEQKVNKL